MTDQIVNSFKGYSTFEEVETPSLRAFNQWTVINNMIGNGLVQLAQEYYDNLSAQDKVAVSIISSIIKMKGSEETSRMITVEIGA